MQDPIITLPPPPLQTPTQPPLKCPRCESSNTKFCYYNNYNLAQPRHFCKDCRRYWTHGGSLRNIPPGGATRKPTTTAKRSIESANPNPNKRQAPDPKPAPEPVKVLYPDSEDGLLQIGGSFSSLLQSSGGQFGNLLDGFDSEPVAGVTFSDNPNPDPQLENLLGLGWPSGWAADLSIYTSPGDHFQ